MVGFSSGARLTAAAPPRQRAAACWTAAPVSAAEHAAVDRSPGGIRFLGGSEAEARIGGERVAEFLAAFGQALVAAVNEGEVLVRGGLVGARGEVVEQA